ncbi:M20 family metallopeptidase [Streptosporangium carneum]|uniref:Glutamate carboxypeptidase n=1 Tax=Streptosporangium carneum TaxID=47481 RepID=A0A9W6MAW2_9ACTN|nr:M20 family metallopeptidase [Streptosporangium carneum]GLK07033.1 glutamate carboxypeptidase [Streptosporangium carneum]
MKQLSAMRWAAHEDAAKMVDRLGELVSCESPPGSTGHLTACADLVASWGESVLGRPARRVVRDGLPHLLWAAPEQRVLLLGHFDTVWPAGTIQQWPFTVTGGTATGPGVCDMKAGIVQMFAALALMADTSRVGVLLTCDEESGSVTSRSLIEREALRSGAVLVCEASTPTGELKVARKGGSVYRFTVHGRAAHAGVEPQRGVNATVEVAHQILTLQALASASEGTSVTPTLLTSGTTTNTVPETAVLSVDVRAWSREELDRVDQRIRKLSPCLAEATLSVDGGINRYPLTPEAALPLLAMAQAAAKDIGLPPPDGAHAPGASDGNFTGALGVPTLDGLGAVGGGAHARGEYVDVRAMPDRAALLAALVERVLAAPS